MNPKALLAAALGIGGLGAGLSHAYLGRLEAEVSGGPKVTVLVAADDLPVGTVLGKAHLALRQVPESYVDRRAIKAADAKRAMGVRVSTGLKASDALMWTDLARVRQDGRELSNLVQAGMRAINVRSEELFDGLLRPGDRIDVLFTADGTDNETSTLLQNLLVLSVDGYTGGSEDDEARSGSGDSVTLSVTAEQAQLITQAEQHGRLRLSVRNADDIVLVEGLPTTRLSDVQKAKDKLHWQPSPETNGETKREIEHVQ